MVLWAVGVITSDEQKGDVYFHIVIPAGVLALDLLVDT